MNLPEGFEPGLAVRDLLDSFDLQLGRVSDRAEAAIEELVAEVMRFAGLLNACDKQNYFLKDANERVKAEVADLRGQRKGWYEVIARLEAEVERLKICGTCAHWDGFDECWSDEDDVVVKAVHDSCEFKRSRWTPYWKKL